MVIATSVESRGGTYQVNVAISVAVLRSTVQTVALFLVVALPILLAGVGFAVWRLIGRALRSVEEIRQAVSTIDAHRMTDRVQVPPTGDEIAALAVTMNGMLDRLQDSQRAQRAFVSDASHELRSPLATLTAAGELAISGDEPSRTRLLTTMNLELARLRGLVDNLMTLARADAECRTGVAVEVDLDDLVAEEARRMTTTGGHRIVLDLEAARVWGDGHRLAQALRNLVDNADRHAATTVRLRLTTAQGVARVTIDNDGPVIPPADRERIFERFVRLDESRSRDAGGSGLGLAIAREAVTVCGGDVVAGEAPDGWCRFELRMPTDAGAAGARLADGPVAVRGRS